MGGRSHRRIFPLATTMVVVAATMLLGSASAGAAIEPLQLYGEPGSGPGGIDSVEGMGVDPISGKVVLADSGNERIEVFSPTGEFLLAFGKDVVPGGGTGPEVCRESCQAGQSGSAAGELDGVREAEVSPDGRIYVSDDDNDRVAVFTMRGKFLFAFGDDVDPAGLTGPEVCTDQCQAGEAGPHGGSLNQPWASAFGPDGDFYITSTNNHRVDRYTPAGEPVESFGKNVNVNGGTGVETCVTDECQPGDDTGAPGSLDRPEGIDFGVDRKLWVGSWDDTRANVFSPAQMTFLRGFGTDVVPGGGTGFEICTTSCQAGSSGTGAGEFGSVQGVAVTASGITYVADSSNSRINAYDEQANFLFAFGDDVDPSGGTGFEVCKQACQTGTAGGLLDNPYPVHVDCRGTVYTASTGIPAAAFGTGKAKPGPCRLKSKWARTRRNGTAMLKVIVPYASKLTVTGRKIKRARGTHEGLEGVERLTVKPSKKLKRKLRRTGKRKNVRVTVKMRPTDGNAVQKRTVKVALKAKKKRG